MTTGTLSFRPTTFAVRFATIQSNSYLCLEHIDLIPVNEIRRQQSRELVVRSVETFSFALQGPGGHEISFAMVPTTLFDVLYFCRYNKASECAGAEVRLGGWEVDGTQYGHSNNVRPAP